MNTPATTGKPGRRSTLATTKSFRYPLFVVMAVSVLLLNSAAQARLLGNDSRHLDSVDSASSSSDEVQDEVSDSSCEEVKAQLSKDCAETTEEHVDVFSSPCEDKQLKVVFDGGSHCCPANATGTEDITGVIPETEVVYTFKEWSCDPIAEPVDKATPTGTGCEAEKLEMSQICAATTMAAVSRFKTACNHPQLKVMFDRGAHCCPPIDYVEGTPEEEVVYTFKEWSCEPLDEVVDNSTLSGTDCEDEKREMSQVCAAATLASVLRFKTACNHPQLKVMFDGGAHCCPPIDFVEIDEHEQLYTFKEWDCEPVEA